MRLAFPGMLCGSSISVAGSGMYAWIQCGHHVPTGRLCCEDHMLCCEALAYTVCNSTRMGRGQVVLVELLHPSQPVQHACMCCISRWG